MNQNQAVAKTDESKALATAQAISETGISASDIIIPSLLLMQNTSEYVGGGKASLGDMVNSQTLEVMASIKNNETLEIVPIRFFKTLKIYDTSQKPPKFLRSEDLTPAKEKLPWEDTENGLPIKRVTCFNFYVLIKKEMDAGEAFPCLVTFKSTSLYAGRQLATQIMKQVMLDRPAWGKSALLAVKLDKKDKNTFAVFEVRSGQVLDAKAMKDASDWVARMKSMSYRVDDQDESADATTPSSAPAPTVVVGSAEESI